MNERNLSPAHSPDEAQALAERVAAAMWARDVASQALGMRLVRVAPGRATLAMPVRPDMLNGHAICHGGFIFTLCDSAFAYACNSYNVNTVASGCAIEFVAPAREGDVLTAVAHERSASGRTGVFDIEVANQRAETVALFRGRSYRIKGHVVDVATSVVPAPDDPTRGQAPAGTQRFSPNDTGFPPERE
jgi:acyl-CoA thioesterase